MKMKRRILMMKSVRTVSMLYGHTEYQLLAQDCENEYTDRRCCLIARRDRSAVKSHVSEQIATFVATLLVRVARASLVAALYADCLGGLLVRAPAVLVL